MQEQSNQSIFTLEGQSKLTMTCVESVDSFSETEIILTVSGKKVTIGGEKLKILSFSQGGGNFAANGEINLVKYGGRKKISKLFR